MTGAQAEPAPVTVPLEHPITRTDGMELAEVTVRLPRARDRRKGAALQTPLERDVHLIGEVSGCGMPVLSGLGLGDYEAILAAIQSFGKGKRKPVYRENDALGIPLMYAITRTDRSALDVVTVRLPLVRDRLAGKALPTAYERDMHLVGTVSGLDMDEVGSLWTGDLEAALKEMQSFFG